MPAAPANEAARVAEQVRADPLKFIADTFGEEAVYDKQQELLLSVRDFKETYCYACYDSGKTWAVSRLIPWWLASYPNHAIVITTAPTWNQVEEVLWREVRAAFGKAKVPLGGKLLQTKLDLGPKWYAIGLSTNDAWNFQGFHEENVLVIIDEADGIAADKWNALEGVLTSENARLVAIGNPLDASSEFKRRVDLARRPRQNVIRIRAEDTPNIKQGKVVYPFLITQDWIDDKKVKWGEDNALFISRVHAEWPSQGVDTVIPIGWLIKAKGREVLMGERAMGVDVARYGSNRTVRTLMEGNLLAWQRVTTKENTMQTAGRVDADIEEYGPAAVAVDDSGVGGGVVDRLRQLGRSIRAVNAGAKPDDNEKYVDHGSELWWRVRACFERGEYGFSMSDPEGVDELIAELNRAKYYYDKEARIKIDKFGLGRGRTELGMTDEERRVRSPDRADAFVLCANATRLLIRRAAKREPRLLIKSRSRS